MRTEKELFEKAEKIYHQYSDSRYPKAIQAFKDLLELYPNNKQGWSMMSTMQSCSKLFDDAIFSINKAIELSPEDAWTINQKCTLLALISRFSADGQIYLDEQKKESYEIKSFPDKKGLIQELILILNKLLELEGHDENKRHRHLWSLAHKYRAINRFDDAIESLVEAKKTIPSKYKGERYDRELANINREISSNYHDKKEFEKAIEFLNEAFKYGLDDYKRTMFADIYEEMGDNEQSRLVLIDLVDRINDKLEKAPEPSYVSQKVAILKRLDDRESLKTVLQHFEDIPDSDYKKKRVAELEIEIKNYLQ
ncbi:tetratricopeptide repeat protein [Marinigracilibium pacificum]|uniref:Tetratricopeptide repeat protein n=1 Tax=Marinigracilibium pacificum TaxID=2729599 RepID=A0A848J6M7_9BACT|nr:hypothetical protein [Marinigracilibium pacificum]NMM50898.1 hypothetical protein [Marinigracilibium pacificum]